MRGLKATSPTAIVAASSTAILISFSRLNEKTLALAQRMIIGATTNWPPTSPSHHVNQMSPNFDGSAYPASTRLATPTVALITVPGANVTPE
jgi:hypothetical protein